MIIWQSEKGGLRAPKFYFINFEKYPKGVKFILHLCLRACDIVKALVPIQGAAHKQRLQSFPSGNQQNASFTFVSLANLFCCFLSMALIMVPKMLFIRKHAHDPREKEDDERDTAEQELKYREVIRENESLQKNIAEVSRVVHTYYVLC